MPHQRRSYTMGHLLIAIAMLCGPRVQSTTIDNTSGTFVNGYANQAAKVCQKALVDCVEAKPGKPDASDLYECIQDGN